MDYELELGLVIGRFGRDLTPDTALEHVFGVTIFNDLSVRNLLQGEMGGRLGPAKGKDFATAVGPWIVSRDELDLTALEMHARVNGELWSSGSSSTITWSIEEILSWASRSESVVPGELIGTGTVPGGCGWELGRQLAPGDEVELEVSGIGVLANTIGAPQAVAWDPVPRSETLTSRQG
jgi:2-keto-4-pentenoate hydratase/2-oxohepta-3-ene-1,7-dioic acid hydratase in catechol pathway